MPLTKKCSVCGAIKGIKDYYKNRANKDGRQGCCRTCTLKQAKAYRSKNPHIIKKTRLKRYGLTLKDYHDLLDKQGNCCAVCETQCKLVVDHSHKTGQVRGLLCYSCNTALGHFKDNPKSLLRGCLYLQGFKEVVK